MRDIRVMFWKEWKELLEAQKSGAIRFLILVGVWGIFLPWQLGAAWLASPVALLFWTWFPFFLVSLQTVGAFAGERERHTLETLLSTRLPDRAILYGKILAGVAYGAVLGLSIYLLGLITADLKLGSFRFYQPALGWGGPCLILLGAVFASGVGIQVSLKAPTMRQAQQTLSVISVILLLLPMFGYPMLPRGFRIRIAGLLSGAGLARGVAMAGVLLAAIDIVLVAVAKARFTRSRLVAE